MLSEYQVDIIGIAAILVAIGVIWRFSKGLNRFFKKVNQVLDDWNGTPGDGNHKGNPGVLKHFQMIDDELSNNKIVRERIEEKVDTAIHELTPNKGGSIKDAIDRIELQQQEEVLERKEFRKRYEQDQVQARMERKAMTKVISGMINLTPEEQSRVWDVASVSWVEGTLSTNDTPED